MAIFRGFIRFYMELNVTRVDLSALTSQRRHTRKQWVEINRTTLTSSIAKRTLAIPLQHPPTYKRFVDVMFWT